MNAPLLYSCDDGIARIVFNRPEVLNAINPDMAVEFLKACRHIAADDSIRVVVISGRGRAFMAGGDVAQFKQGPESIAETLIDPMHEGLQILAGLRMPVVGSVQGPAAGAGMSIALASDIVIAADNCRFTSAYVNLGTSCDLGASWSLPRLVGLQRAMGLMLLSESVDANAAMRMGFVSRVVPAEDLEGETEVVVQRLAKGAPVAQGKLKALLRTSLERTLEAQLAAEREAFVSCAQTHDFAEGVDAFVTRRVPLFTGN